MMKKELLKSLKMPVKGKDPMLSMESSEEEMPMEGEDEMMMEEMPEEPASPLADVADEDLIAEMKLRGLSLDGPAEEEMEMEEMPMDDEEMPA